MTDILIKDIPPALYRAIQEEKQRTGSLLSPLCRAYLASVPENPPIREIAEADGPARVLRVRHISRKTKDRLTRIAKNHGLRKNEVYLRTLEHGVIT